MLCKNSICNFADQDCEVIWANELAQVEGQIDCPRQEITCNGSGPRLELSPGGWVECDALLQKYENPCEVCRTLHGL